LILSGAVAASIFLMVFINYGSGNNSHEELVAQYWPIEAGLPVKMSSKGKYDKAMNAYKQEQWIKAEILFEQIESDTSSYFLGIINYEQKEYDNAVKHLSEVSSTSAWHDESQFRLALVYLKQKQVEKAKELLKEIATSNSIYIDEATAILLNL